jgi:hypothetical protein
LDPEQRLTVAGLQLQPALPSVASSFCASSISGNSDVGEKTFERGGKRGVRIGAAVHAPIKLP